MAAAPHTWCVYLAMCGMACRLYVRAATEARAIKVAENYLLSSGMAKIDVATSISSAYAQKITIVEDVLDAVAAQNHFAADKTTVDYCENTGKFTVNHGGEVMDWFPTRKEAEAFAMQHDKLITGARLDNVASAIG